MSKILHAALGALTFAWGTSVLAQSGMSAAELEFEAGQAAEQAGDLERACTHFRAAMGLDRKAGALRQSARCDAREGHVLDAIAKMDEALAQIPADNPYHAEYAAERVSLKAALARLTLTLRPGTSSLVVMLDGKAAPPWGEARELDPGEHVLLVQGAGVTENTFMLEKGESKTLELPFAAVVMPSVQPSASGGPPWLVFAGVSFGVAGAAAIATIATGALILESDSEAEAACSTPERVGCQTAIDDTNALLAPNLAFWIVMGVSAGAGLAFTIVDVTTTDSASDAMSTKTTVHVGPGSFALSRSF